MLNLTNVFDVSGAGSRAELENIRITNIDMRQVTPPSTWIGVNARNQGTVIIRDSSFTDSTNVRHAISADGQSSVTVINFDGNNLTGGRQVVSDPS